MRCREVIGTGDTGRHAKTVMEGDKVQRTYSVRVGGFSLIEVLVSAVVMSSGLAGLAALLMTALSGTASAADRAAAAMLADAMVAQLRISPTVSDVFLQPAPASPPDCSAAGACSAEQFAGAALGAWQQTVMAQLPAGRGLVCLDGTPEDGSAAAPACDGQPSLAVKLFWSPARGAPERLARLAQ